MFSQDRRGIFPCAQCYGYHALGQLKNISSLGYVSCTCLHISLNGIKAVRIINVDHNAPQRTLPSPRDLIPERLAQLSQRLSFLFKSHLSVGTEGWTQYLVRQASITQISPSSIADWKFQSFSLAANIVNCPLGNNRIVSFIFRWQWSHLKGSGRLAYSSHMRSFGAPRGNRVWWIIPSCSMDYDKNVYLCPKLNNYCSCFIKDTPSPSLSV